MFRLSRCAEVQRVAQVFRDVDLHSLAAQGCVAVAAEGP